MKRISAALLALALVAGLVGCVPLLESGWVTEKSYYPEWIEDVENCVYFDDGDEGSGDDGWYYEEEDPYYYEDEEPFYYEDEEDLYYEENDQDWFNENDPYYENEDEYNYDTTDDYFGRVQGFESCTYSQVFHAEEFWITFEREDAQRTVQVDVDTWDRLELGDYYNVTAGGRG